MRDLREIGGSLVSVNDALLERMVRTLAQHFHCFPNHPANKGRLNKRSAYKDRKLPIRYWVVHRVWPRKQALRESYSRTM